jgi:alpha-tubulin suppressor-like RCC1 family protein
LLNNGELYTCGSNKYEQLGLNRKHLANLHGKKGADGEEKKNEIAEDLLPEGVKKRLADLEATQDVEKPTQVAIVHDAVSQKVAYVCAGYFHVHICTQEGAVFGWGRNDRG